MKNNKLKYTLPYICMVAPALIIFVFFFVLPLFYTIVYSFFQWTNYSAEISFASFANYKAMLEDGILATGTRNSLQYAIMTVLLQNLVSLPISVLLNSKIKGRNMYRAIFFCPAVLSTLVVGYLWKYLLSSSDYGFVNQLLTGMGLEKVNFFGNGSTAMWIIIFVEVWQWFGWSMVIYLGNLQSISEELYEAAAVDGASVLKKFWHITIPGLAPAIKINLVTGMISGLKVFDIVVSTTGGGPAHRTETILTLMFSKFSDGNYGYASAFGVMFLMVTMFLAVVVLGGFKKWEDYLGQ